MNLFNQSFFQSLREGPELLVKCGIRRCLLFLAVFFVLSPAALQAQEWIYTVRPGDNLWDLSERYLISRHYWQPLQRLNRISEPKKLRPGTRLKIPVAWLKIQPVPVRVLSVSGEVFFQSAARGESKPLSAGGLLQIEDSVRTGPKSSATLVFADGSHLFLQADSVLTFDVVRAYGETGMIDTRIRLKKGKLGTNVSPGAGSGTRFEIHTPGAITAVRGTELRVANDVERGISSTEVLKGRVDVIAAGTVQTVTAGFGTVVKAGHPPSIPRVLLQAPNLKGLPERFKQLPLRFIWPGLAGANAYRIQLYKNGTVQTLSFEGLLEKAELILSDLPNASYVMHVRGVDVLALEGFNAVHHFSVEVPAPLPPKAVNPVPPPVIEVRSPPPRLLNPLPDDVIDLEIPEFEWEAVFKANVYHFQLSNQAEFFSPIIDIADFSAHKIKAKQPLKPGTYYWRVAAGEQAGQYGIFSPMRAFKVRSRPSRLKLSATQIENKQLQIHWQGGKPDERYQVELARDTAFRELIVQEEVAEMNTSLDRPAPGLYYLRVRAITPEGIKGEYSAARSVEVPFHFCVSFFVLCLAGILAVL